MKLRTKVAVLIVGLFAVFVGAVYSIQQRVVFPSFLDLEREEALKDIDRAREALSGEIGHLAVQCKDWAAWDDTYQFIVDGNEAYKEATLLPVAFESAEVNLVYYFKEDGSLHWGKMYDLDTLEPIAAETVGFEVLARQYDLIGHESTESRKTGLVMTRRGPLLVASLPILTSEAEGPIRGTLMMGRFLNAAKIEQLAQQTRLDLVIYATGDAAIPDGDKAAIGRLTGGVAALTVPRTPNELDAYTFFKDINGRPSLLMRAKLDRNIASEGVASMRFAMGSILTAGTVTLLLTLLLLQRVVLGPIAELTKHATTIGSTGNLDRKVTVRRRDEIGTLGCELNRMVDGLADSRAKLLDASRQAGMADIASGILHNVGNVLNSVNVSATLAAEKVRKLDVPDLQETVAMLREHDEDLGTYLTSDQKGRLIPAFLSEIGEALAEEQHSVMEELRLLTDNVEHIKGIVNMQQSYARALAVEESVSLADLVEDALRINAAGMERHGVRIAREFTDVPRIVSDKHKILQILVNLLNNAKYAVDECPKESRVVTVRLGPSREEGYLQVAIVDNGVGIPAENLTRVFAQGFTTRQEGNGLGLHTSAVAARSLGGSVTAASPGPDMGATFTLKIPKEPACVADGR